ncbi:hypothetical protein MTBPR1_220002 [Candidatus Terasakiella magnetica]|uniref:Uncharacterized protein n=1 Tax=Candidatus Terasakiella magnetica TaxID=1867952 RepID=A0A1C3RH38_9PROT|nr:hypothetical protein [Candidatus Terasakiella magnetica]SCA56569.1 hypothetical protein MTBPR1_220002 [Candidatus Terasakiella magnetica]
MNDWYSNYLKGFYNPENNLQDIFEDITGEEDSIFTTDKDEFTIYLDTCGGPIGGMELKELSNMAEAYFVHEYWNEEAELYKKGWFEQGQLIWTDDFDWGLREAMIAAVLDRYPGQQNLMWVPQKTLDELDSPNGSYVSHDAEELIFDGFELRNISNESVVLSFESKKELNDFTCYLKLNDYSFCHQADAQYAIDYLNQAVDEDCQPPVFVSKLTA